MSSKGCGIVVKEGEPLEKMVHRFNKFCEKQGVLADIKNRTYFEKPSDKRRRKRNKIAFLRSRIKHEEE